jgi:hypothetical protein
MQPEVFVKLCETLLRRKNSRQRHEAKASRAEEDGVFLVLDACWILREPAWRLRIERTRRRSTCYETALRHFHEPTELAIRVRPEAILTLLRRYQAVTDPAFGS